MIKGAGVDVFPVDGKICVDTYVLVGQDVTCARDLFTEEQWANTKRDDVISLIHKQLRYLAAQSS